MPKALRNVGMRAIRVATARYVTDDELRKQELHQQGLYLGSLRQDGTLTSGCKAAHVSAHTVYGWRENDPTFVVREHEAREAFADMLETEIVRRGVHGTQKPIYQGGELVGHQTEYSDRMLELAAKGARPGKFRERLDVAMSQSIVVRVVSARVDPAALT